VKEEIDPGGQPVFVPVLGPLYGDRLADYHRLDVRARREYRLRRGTLTFFVDVQNLYARNNIAGFDVQIDEDDGDIELTPEYWVRFLPSAGVTFEF